MEEGNQRAKPKYKGRLQAKVKKAANLIPKKWNGSVDSYCILKVGQTNRTTKTLVATTCPEWNQNFTLHVIYPFANLELVVWDKALAGSTDVFLGQVTIPLSDLSENSEEPLEKWYRLRGRDADEDQEVGGEVKLSVQYEYINSWRVIYEAISVYKAGEFQRATQLLEESMKIIPDSMELLSFRSSAFLQLRNFEEALRLAEEIIVSWPRAADGYLRKGQVFYVMNRYEEARRAFHLGLQQNPKNQELLQTLETMDSNEVRKEIKALVENGKRSFDERKFGDALSAFSRAIPKDPNNYLFYLSRAMISMTVGNTSDAKMDITKSVELEQTWPKRLVTKQGYLKKEGEVNRMMKKRWFVLNRCFLFYYRSSKDLIPLGVVCLDEVLDKKGKWIGLQSLGRTYLLMTDTPNEAKEWRLALRTATQKELLLPEELEEGDAWVPNDSRMSRKPGAKAKFRPGNVMLTLTSEEGYLYKLGHINRTWVQRWFIIKDTAVYYFDYKQVERSAPVYCKGAVLLDGATVRNVQRAEILGQGIAVPLNVCIFAITSAGEQIYLYAESEEDREMWKEAIKALNRKGKFPNDSTPLPSVVDQSETEIAIGSLEEKTHEGEGTKKEEENTPSSGKSGEGEGGEGEKGEDEVLPGSLIDLHLEAEPKRERRNHSLSIATVQRKKKTREKLQEEPSAAESRYFAELGIGDMPSNTIVAPPENPVSLPGYGSVSESDTEVYNSFDERMLNPEQEEVPLVQQNFRQQKVHEEKKCCDSCVIL